MSEKVGRPGRERVHVSLHGRENCQDSNVLPDNFFVIKRGTDVISHVIRAFEYFSSFLKYIFRHKLASFCCFFSANLYTVFPLSN